MQVLAQNNQIDSQHRILLDLLQKFVDIHTDYYENPYNHRQQSNSILKQEWSYLRDLLKVQTLNKNSITSYFSILERNQRNNNNDISPTSCPPIKNLQSQYETNQNQQQNTKISTINPNDIPKNAFQKNCFRRSVNSALNKNNNNSQLLMSFNSLPFDPKSPQVQLQSQPQSERQFSQALQQIENTIQSTRTPKKNNPSLKNYEAKQEICNNKYVSLSSQGDIQKQQPTYSEQIKSQSCNYQERSQTINQQRGLIRIDEATINAPSFPQEQLQQQNEIQQKAQQLSKFNNIKDNSQTSSLCGNSTKNSQDISNNISSFQANQTTNSLISPTISGINQPSNQIETLKNQFPQFHNDYKTHQIDLSKNYPQQQNEFILSLSKQHSNTLQNQNGFSGQTHLLQNHHTIQHSHSLENHYSSYQLQTQPLQHFRAKSPNTYNFTNNSNRPSSPLAQPPSIISNQSSFEGIKPKLQTSNSTKNALNYKNKLLQAANQAIPLNQLSIIQTPLHIQPKSESFSGGYGNQQSIMSTLIMTNNQNNEKIQLSKFSQEQNENIQPGQMNLFPLINGISPREQTVKQIISTFSEYQQQLEDNVVKYKFKNKIILEKTILLETQMKNNSDMLNLLFKD